MKPSSSISDPPEAEPPGGLFDGLFAHGPVPAAVSDRAWVAALLAAEAALARAQAGLGLVPPAAAAAVTTACADPARFDPVALGRAAVASGTPVLPLVQALREAVPAEYSEFVHFGATSQDILDTAAMLVTRDAVSSLLAELAGAADAAGRLARTHRDSRMAGRTLLQYARPTTFGLVAAGWRAGLRRAAARLTELHAGLPVQLGGAVGTWDRWPAAGAALVARFAAELDLTAPVLPWHTERTRIGELAGALGVAAGAAATVARDVALLAGTDAGELAEAAPGASSAMPHKRNPVASVAALACASQAPGLVNTLLAAMAQEHQRAAGSWQAEWRALPALLVATGSAVAWLRECLAGLVVHPEAMRQNLTRQAGPGPADPGAAAALVDAALEEP